MLPSVGTFTSTMDGGATQATPDERPLFGAGQDAYYPVRVYDPATRFQYFVAPRQEGFVFQYKVARAPVDSVRDASSYEYWAGKDTWVKGDQTAAQSPVGMDVVGNTASLSWNAHLKKFVLVSGAFDHFEVRPTGEMSGDLQVLGMTFDG
jgi:hypothetical protein